MWSFNYTSELNELQTGFRAVIVTSVCITIAFVLLRNFIRIRVQSQFSIDDTLLVLALAGFIIQTSFAICSMYAGSGCKTTEIPPNVYRKGLKWMALAQCTYTISLMLTKLSIAFLQLRILGLANDVLRKTHYVSIGLNLVIALYEFFTLLFQCYPDQGGVQRPVILSSTDCTNRDPVVVSVFIYSVVNILLDWYYSLAMVPLIYKMQNVKPIVKISAIMILGMGFFASVAVIIRFKYIISFADTKEPNVAQIPVGVWSWIEQCLALCAASIATFGPLLRFIPPLSSSRSRIRNEPYRTAGGDGGVGRGPYMSRKSRLKGRVSRSRGEGGVIRVGDRLALEQLEDESETVRGEWGAVWDHKGRDSRA